MPPLSSVSVSRPLPCTLNSFTVAPAWCQHIITRWEMDGPAAREFPSAQQEVNAVRESGAVTPPAWWHRYASPPLRGLRWLAWHRARVPSPQRSEPAGFRSRAVRKLVKTVPMMDFIYSVLELLAVMGSTCLAHIQTRKKERQRKITKPQATAETLREKKRRGTLRQPSHYLRWDSAFRKAHRSRIITKADISGWESAIALT